MSQPASSLPPLPKALSPSAAQAFEQCPRLFFWSKVERISEPANEATARGRIVHSGLENLFDLPRDDRNLESLWKLVTDAWEDAKADSDYADVLSAPSFDEEAFLATVREACEKYFRLERPWRFDPKERELKLGGNVEGVRLFGIVDRFDSFPEHGTFITDYKTGKAPSARFREEAFFQLFIYAALMKAVRGVDVDELRLVYLGDPHAVVSLKVTSDRLNAVTKRVAGIWSSIEKAYAAGEFPTKTSKLCDWCWFQDFCPAFAPSFEAASAAAKAKGVPVRILSPSEYPQAPAAEPAA